MTVPIGGPSASRSSTARLAGVAARSARRSPAASSASTAASLLSCSAGRPSPAGYGEQISSTLGTTCSSFGWPYTIKRSSRRRSAARTVRPSVGAAHAMIASTDVVSPSSTSRLSRAASRISSVKRSSPSSARATDTRDCARAASADMSVGAGVSRSGRRASSAASASSEYARRKSVRLPVIVVLRYPAAARTAAGAGHEISERCHVKHWSHMCSTVTGST